MIYDARYISDARKPVSEPWKIKRLYLKNIASIPIQNEYLQACHWPDHC